MFACVIIINIFKVVIKQFHQNSREMQVCCNNEHCPPKMSQSSDSVDSNRCAGSQSPCGQTWGFATALGSSYPRVTTSLDNITETAKKLPPATVFTTRSFSQFALNAITGKLLINNRVCASHHKTFDLVCFPPGDWFCMWLLRLWSAQSEGGRNAFGAHVIKTTHRLTKKVGPAGHSSIAFNPLSFLPISVFVSSGANTFFSKSCLGFGRSLYLHLIFASILFPFQYLHF